MKIEQLLIVGVIAFVGIKYVLPKLNLGGSPAVSVPTATAGPNGVTAALPGGTSASAKGSDITVCTNGHCETHTGDNISVSCTDGKCHSNNAQVIRWSY
jgi:hypothetical protein